MELDRLTAALAAREVVGAARVEIRDLAYDTRAVGPGSLFFCVPGATRDGHDLAGEAIAAGAVALVVERPLPAPVPQIVVDSVRRAMPAAASVFFGAPSHELDVAAVTGTNGKTTTAFLLASILDAAGRRPGLLTNIERRIGGESRPTGLNTPEAIDLQRLFREMLDAGDRSCAMEATSIASAKGRLDGTRFAVLVFTNLTQDHLDFHGTMEDYYAAKRALFEQAERAVVNVGDEWGRRLAAELPHARTFTPDDELDGFELKLRGAFNRANALAAIGAARELGVDEEAIARGIAAVDGVPGRFEEVDAGQPFTVLVDYAHTPDSLANVLRAARTLGDRLFVVFGAGGDRDRDKRPLMGRVAAELADHAIVTTDNPRSEDPARIAAEVADGALEIVLDRRDAIGRALASARAGDVVVIAGKGADTEMEIDGRFVPFDDRAVAREILGAAPAGSAAAAHGGRA
ncbi:MAG TPA: UDP-N-acetylmuramoyl-L-alanyl-D-glutamate--2,6-diaminopimelate ligase [Gaiellaceae bacterium]|nr:UDP-N-acetylmuramoyl-L-alanyl-D-glutamate--2,6-diaminopimelate ligase [Gaiellaceae bacterium]